MNLFELMAVIQLSTSSFTNGIKDASETMQSFGDRVSSIVTAAGKAVEAGLTIASAAAIKFAKDSVDVGKQFDAAMANVAAISGATGEAFNGLRETAIAMGGSTRFSATEAAEALGYMAMAGWDTQEMTDGLKGVMDLAAASGEGLARVADIVTDALTAFGLGAEDSAHFADVLAVASSAANTNVSMMGETFKYVAPLAGTLGYSIENMSVAIGLMANSGIKASQAGTSLRAGLSRLVKPSNEATEALKKLGLTVQDMSDEEIATRTAALEQSVTVREKAYLDEEEALQDSLDRQYETLKKSLDARYNAVKETYDSEYDALQKSLNKQYDAQKEAFDEEYDERKKALDKSYNAARDIYDKEYDERKKALEAAYDALEKTLDDEIDAVQRAQEQELSDVQKNQEAQVREYEEAAEAKISSIDEIYKESLKNTDEAEYKRLQELDAEIAKIQAESDKAVKEAEEAERKQRRAELQAAVDNAKNLEARYSARQKLKEYEASLERKDAEAKRKADIADLKALKDKAKEEAKAAREAAKETRDANLKAAKEENAEGLQALKDRQKDEIAELKNAQKAELEEKKSARKDQLDAMKESNAEDLEELKKLNDWRLETIKELNDGELKALKKSHSDQLDALKESNNDQLKALKKSHSDQLSAIKDGNEEKLKESKRGYSKQLQALKDAHKEQLQEYKDSVKQQTAELKKQGEARAAVLTDENGNTRDLINFDKEHLGLINILREKFNGMTEAEQSSTAAAIFGQEAMSGWLAILNASDEEFTKLVAQIDVASVSNEKFAEAMEANGFSADAMRASMARLGITQEEFDAALNGSNGKVDDFKEALLKAADSGITLADIDSNLTMSGEELTKVFEGMSAAAIMAGTHEDSLAGSATTLGSALETLRIRISDKLTPTIREFTEFAQTSVVALTKAFEESDFDGMLDALGPIISDGIGMILKYVPKVVTVGGQILGAVVTGIINNLPILADGMWTVATELGTQLLNAAPDIAEKGGELLNFLAGGIIENADMLMNTAINLIDVFAGFLAEAIPSVAEKLTGVVVAIANALSDPNGLNNLAQSAITILDAIANALIINVPRLGGVALDLLRSFGGTLIDHADELVNIAVNLLDMLAGFIVEAIPIIARTAVDVIASFAAALYDPSTLDNLVQSGGAILERLITAILEGLPRLAESASEVMRNFANYLRDNLPEILKVGLEMLVSLSGSIRENAGKLIDSGLDLLLNLAKGFADSIPTLIENVPTIISNIAGVINDNAPKIIATGVQIILTLAMGIIQAIPTLIAEFPKILKAILDVFTAFNWLNLGKNAVTAIKDGVTSLAHAIPNAFTSIRDTAANFLKTGWKNVGQSIINAIVNAVTSLKDTIPNAFKNIVDDIINKFTSIDWLKIGSDIINGIWKGITAPVDGLLAGVGGVVSGIMDKFTGSDGFDEHSPSKWSEKVFRNVLQGGEIGLERGLPGILSGAENAVRDIQDAISADPFNVSGGYQLSGGYSFAEPRLAAASATSGQIETVLVEQPIVIQFNETKLGEAMLRYFRTQQRAGGGKTWT